MRRSQAGRTWRVSSDAPSCVARYAQLQLPRGAGEKRSAARCAVAACALFASLRFLRRRAHRVARAAPARPARPSGAGGRDVEHAGRRGGADASSHEAPPRVRWRSGGGGGWRRRRAARAQVRHTHQRAAAARHARALTQRHVTQRRAAERSPSGAHLRGGATGAHAARRPVAAASAHEPGARPHAADPPASMNQGALHTLLSVTYARAHFSSAARAEPGAVVQMLAGALAGGVARVFVAPLDVVKIRMQARPLSFSLPFSLSWSFQPGGSPRNTAVSVLRLGRCSLSLRAAVWANTQVCGRRCRSSLGRRGFAACGAALRQRCSSGCPTPPFSSPLSAASTRQDPLFPYSLFGFALVTLCARAGL